MVALPRRFAALLIALIASLSLAGTALASAKDVINDYLDGGVISECHPRADYDSARLAGADPQYGDLNGALDAALLDPTLVGTAERPCPDSAAADDGGSGIGAALIAIPIAVAVLAGAILLARRRRVGSSEPDGQA